MCPGFCPPPPSALLMTEVMLLPLFKNKFMFPTLVTLAQHGLQNEDGAETPYFSVSLNSILSSYSFISCCLIAGGLMIFSAVSRVSLFEVDDDTNDLVGAVDHVKQNS